MTAAQEKKARDMASTSEKCEAEQHAFSAMTDRMTTEVAQYRLDKQAIPTMAFIGKARNDIVMARAKVKQIQGLFN